MTQPADASSNFIWPPTIFCAAFIAAALAGHFAPWPMVAAASPRLALLIAGFVLAGAGGLVALAAEISFWRARTATLPTRPTRVIVDTGVYARTRNPMYLGMALALAGVGLMFNSWWCLAALPFAIFAVTKLAIEREERYLEQKFGVDFRDYRARVRRWL